MMCSFQLKTCCTDEANFINIVKNNKQQFRKNIESPNAINRFDVCSANAKFQEVRPWISFSPCGCSNRSPTPAVTRLIGNLETQLGVRLLQRTTRRVALTDAGEIYLARVRHILTDVDEAQAAAQQHAQEMSGVIRVLSPPVFAVHVLARLVAGFAELHPAVRLDIHVDSAASPPIEDFDLTLMSAGDGFDANIVARPIVSSAGILCASPKYLRAHGTPQQPEDLPAHRCLRFKQPANRHRVWQLTQAGNGQQRDITIDPTLVTNHTDTLLDACVDGAGITSQSHAMVAHLIHRGDLVRVLKPWTTGTNTLYAALPSRKFIPARTSAFLDYLTQRTRAVVEGMPGPAPKKSRGGRDKAG
jgi:DNA-binding transcriptional LysR family regulator